VNDYSKQHWLVVQEPLLNGTYEPQTVRRVEIPKRDGGMRKLGIPTVPHRLIQQSVMQVLQRRWIGRSLTAATVFDRAICSSSSGAGAEVYRRRLWLVRRS
jgi:retron-type reverse transcriptase